jgi:hypothetical protein
MPQFSAIDAISPAFQHTKRQLFAPFRFDLWLRLGVVSLVTGEFAGGSGGAGNVSIPSGSGTTGRDFMLQSIPLGAVVEKYLPWILAGLVVVMALGIIAVYIASVFRFILFDTVLTDRSRLTEGWRRWQELGGSFFLWQFGFTLALTAALAVVVGGPLYLAWRGGVFRQPEEHMGLLFAGGVALFFLAAGVILVALLLALLAKDFVVPVMALENLRVLEAWRRLLPMLLTDKIGYLGYVLMRIVLAVGSAILFGIVNLILLLVLILTLGAAGTAIVFAGSAAGLSWNYYTIGLAVAVVSAPAMVFFQAYTLYFLGPRYPLLGARLAGRPPSPTTAMPAAP